MNLNFPVRSLYSNEVAYAEALQQALEQILSALDLVPQGAIVARTSVLPGWFECDGTNGTPDLVADNLPGLIWIMKA